MNECMLIILSFFPSVYYTFDYMTMVDKKNKNDWMYKEKLKCKIKTTQKLMVDSLKKGRKIRLCKMYINYRRNQFNKKKKEKIVFKSSMSLYEYNCNS
jgi:hypothetical protein